MIMLTACGKSQLETVAKFDTKGWNTETATTESLTTYLEKDEVATKTENVKGMHVSVNVNMKAATQANATMPTGPITANAYVVTNEGKIDVAAQAKAGEMTATAYVVDGKDVYLSTVEGKNEFKGHIGFDALMEAIQGMMGGNTGAITTGEPTGTPAEDAQPGMLEMVMGVLQQLEAAQTPAEMLEVIEQFATIEVKVQDGDTANAKFEVKLTLKTDAAPQAEAQATAPSLTVYVGFKNYALNGIKVVLNSEYVDATITAVTFNDAIKFPKFKGYKELTSIDDIMTPFVPASPAA